MTANDQETFKRLQPEEYHKQFYDQGLRPDGRTSLTALRPVSSSVSSIKTADGSSVVKQGDTAVVCGIKLEIAEPNPETPSEGTVQSLGKVTERSNVL